MRLIGLIVVVAIVYLAYGRQTKEQSPTARVAAAQEEAAKVMPPQPQQQPVAAPTPQGGGLRAPIDRTRSVMELVKGRN